MPRAYCSGHAPDPRCGPARTVPAQVAGPEPARGRRAREGAPGFSRRRPLRSPVRQAILNHMVQLSSRLDTAFGALSDPTRRGILERLGRGDASISELATSFDMTLTGMKKHRGILEGAGLLS